MDENYEWNYQLEGKKGNNFLPELLEAETPHFIRLPKTVHARTFCHLPHFPIWPFFPPSYVFLHEQQIASTHEWLNSHCNWAPGSSIDILFFFRLTLKVVFRFRRTFRSINKHFFTALSARQTSALMNSDLGMCHVFHWVWRGLEWGGQRTVHASGGKEATFRGRSKLLLA